MAPYVRHFLDVAADMEVYLVLAVAALLINLVTFYAFWVDKQRAQRQAWRISEGTLLALAVFGGWFGAKLAQHRFRHKTRKQPFARQLSRVPVTWGFLACLALALPHLPEEWIHVFAMEEPEPRHRGSSLPQIGF